MIVFFVFFRSTNQKEEDLSVNPIEIQSLEERIQILEKRVDLQNSQGAANPSIDSYNSRVERVEAALSMKFDLVSGRLSELEKIISGLDKRLEQSTKARPPEKKVTVKKVTVKKPVVKKAPAKAATKSPVFHMVKKGDTLYGIGRRYKITVKRLRTLNKLSAKAEIYPGDNLRVR